MKKFDYVVIGGGPAGGAAAIELARNVDRPSVALIGEESFTPYERPPLSKATLAALPGQHKPQLLFGSADDLAAAGVTPFIPARAVRVDPATRVVELASGVCMGYGSLLFATGAAPRRLSTPGATLGGIHYLRTFDHALALSAELGPGKKIVVVGGGFIGLEVSATARKAGCKATVVEAGLRLMARGVPEVISRAVKEKFQTEGVNLILGKTVHAFHGEQRIRAVELDDGTLVEADCVAVGVGAIPNTTLAREAGLEIRDGIVADALGRTSDPYCFAAGDVANRHQGLPSHPLYIRRLEAWEPAIEQAIATAKAMRGESCEPAGFPWLWSDQFDWNLQIAGYGELADTTITRPGAEAGAMTVFQLYQQRLIGVVTLNEGRNMTLLRRALQRGLPLDASRLADPGVPLRQALSEAAATISQSSVH